MPEIKNAAETARRCTHCRAASAGAGLEPRARYRRGRRLVEARMPVRTHAGNLQVDAVVGVGLFFMALAKCRQVFDRSVGNVRSFLAKVDVPFFLFAGSGAVDFHLAQDAALDQSLKGRWPAAETSSRVARRSSFFIFPSAF